MDDSDPLTSTSPSNTHLACLPSHTRSDKCWANQGDICITHWHLMSARMHTQTLKRSVMCQAYSIMLEAKFTSERSGRVHDSKKKSSAVSDQ